jgi:exopolysaccharide production protein ExoY
MNHSSTSIIDDRRSDLEIGIVKSSPETTSDLQQAAKRALDVIGAAAFLILFSPLLLGVAVLVFAVQGRPLLYGHTRIGRNGRAFRCYKFRTMVKGGDRVLAAHLEKHPHAKREWEQTRKLKDDPRVTPLGRTLRKLSVDEFPQFLNVLIGEMSLVGPRPIVASEGRYYGPDFGAYLSVRPGITGVWQVSGRSNTSYEQRVRMDVEYAASWSLKGDLMILAKTLPAVLSLDGSV